MTLPSHFVSPLGGSIVPLDSVRLIKLGGGAVAIANSPAWQQVCDSADGIYFFANTSLQALVDRAQSQICIQSDLQMCYPPAQTASVISFGLPLPIGFITDSDFAGASLGNPSSLQVEFIVQAFDNAAKANIFTSISMAVQLSALGYTAQCETMSAAQTLADIIKGNIYIGTATTDYEWDATMQKQTDIQTPGSTPASSLEFQTTTVQGSVMTFAALGDPTYFEDPRYQGQTVNINEIFTIHFLEPLGGKGGDTPHFNAVKALFFAGGAFSLVKDPVTHAMWMQPTTALLNICPLRPTVGKLACLTRVESTFKDNVLTRSPTAVIELRMSDPTSIVEMQGLMSQMLLQGGSNSFTTQLGSGFYSELASKLNLNNRYRKAYVVNPVMNWQMDAMQVAQPGATAFTVCTKIIGIAMVTLHSADGQQLARRLLSTDLDFSPAFFHDSDNDAYDVGDEAEDVISFEQAHEEGGNGRIISDHILLDSPHHLVSAAPIIWNKDAIVLNQNDDDNHDQRRRRRLLQQQVDSSNSLTPSKQQTSNSLVMALNVPGYDAASQLCPSIGATLANCKIVQYTMQVQGFSAQQLCSSHDDGTLGTILNAGVQTNLMQDANHASNVTYALVMDFSVSGCPPASTSPAARRRLFADSMQLVIVISKVLLNVNNGVTSIDPSRLQYIQFFMNATIMQELLGGSATIVTKDPQLSIPATGFNGSFFGNITIIWGNVTKNYSNITDILNQRNPPPDKNITNNDRYFFITDAPQSSGRRLYSAPSLYEAVAVLTANGLLALTVIFVFSSF